VTTETAFSESGLANAFSGIETLDTVRETGFIGIELATSAEVTVTEHDGLEKIAVQKLPHALVNRSARPLIMGFKYLKHPHSLVFEVKKHERIAVPIATINSASVVTLFTEDGKIVHRRRCDGSVMAHGIQLHYPADRIDEVMAFIEFLQSFDRARRLAIVSGEIDDSGLGAVLDMFVNTAPSGTLSVSRGEDEGKIAFSENYILRCTVGMVSGMKALARMVRWTEGHFEFHRDLQLSGEPDDPQPLDAAMMVAAIQADELARIGFDASATSNSFRIDPEARKAHHESLTDLEREVLECAADGFSVGAISDMITAPDADIYKAFVVLLDLGVIERQG